MSKRSLAIAAMAMTLFGALAPVSVAQLPMPLPGIPMCPVDHPALALQPRLGGNDSGSSASEPAPGARLPMDCPGQPEPETAGAKRSGKDLKKAVAVVGKLHWHDKLGDVRVQAAATGKPIVLLQALGDLEGFA